MPDVTLQDIKKTIEEIGHATEELRRTHEAKIKALESRGTADPLFDEKLERINDALSDMEKVQRKAAEEARNAAKRAEAVVEQQKAEADNWIAKAEAKLNRSLLGLGGGALEADSKAAETKRVFDDMLRKGVENMKPDEVKVLYATNDTTGGYLAPPQFLAEVIKAEVLYSPMRSLVTVRQTGSSELQQPKRTQTAAATWVGDTSTRAETQNVAWGLVKIPVHEMYAEARVTWANLEDAQFSLDSLLQEEFGEQFGVSEGAAIVSGNGVGKPLGFLDANAAGPSTPIAYTFSGQAATIASATAGNAGQGNGLVNLFHAVKTAYAQRGSWVLNRASLGKVRLIQDTTGQYLWQPGLASNAGPTLLGAPYTEVPDMPDEASNAFPIAFGDWRRAITLVDRLEVAVSRDPYSLTSSGQVKFTARRRLGAQVVLGEAIRLYKCATS